MALMDKNSGANIPKVSKMSCEDSFCDSPAMQ